MLINRDMEHYVRASTSGRAESRAGGRSLAASSPVGISVAMALFVYDVSTARGMKVVALAPLEYTAREVPLEDCVF